MSMNLALQTIILLDLVVILWVITGIVRGWRNRDAEIERLRFRVIELESDCETWAKDWRPQACPPGADTP